MAMRRIAPRWSNSPRGNSRAMGSRPIRLRSSAARSTRSNACLQAHLRPGDIVAVEDPSYTGVLDLVAALALVAEPVAIDDSGPLAADLKRALKLGAKAFILTPRAQNPSGAALDRKRAAELRQVLAAFPDVVVDRGRPRRIRCRARRRSRCRRGRAHWATVRSVSKSLGPDLRVSVIAGDALTVARVQGRQSLGPRWVSHILQDLVAMMWADAATPAILQKAADTYAHRRRALIEALAQHGIEARGRSGLNVWVPVAEEAGGGERDGGERMGDSRRRVLSNQKRARNPRDGIDTARRRRWKVRG